MTDFLSRHPLNAPGKYYVDFNCIDCDACRATAPDLFQRDDSRGASYVIKQPATAEEERLAKECVEGCCTEAIGHDGNRYDWMNAAPSRWDEDAASAPLREEWVCPEPRPLNPEEARRYNYYRKRPWWKFW